MMYGDQNWIFQKLKFPTKNSEKKYYNFYKNELSKI